MTTQTVNQSLSLAERLQTLVELYGQGQNSQLMDRTLAKLLHYEAAMSQAQLEQLEADLAEFERKYDLASTEFYAQFQAGQLGDEMDFIEWASLVQMAANLRRRLQALTAGISA